MNNRFKLPVWTFIVLLLVPAPFAAQSVADAKFYDTAEWTLVTQGRAQLPGSEPADVLLLETVASTGKGGNGQPMRGVQLLIIRNGRLLFDYRRDGSESFQKTTGFFMDDVLDIRDVTSDGTPEIIFHSGNVGASDAVTTEHVLSYDAARNFFVDIAADEFFSSGAHAAEWLRLDGRHILVIGRRGAQSSISQQERCPACPGYFVFDAYEWNARENTFALIRTLPGDAVHSSGRDALRNERSHIRAILQK